VGRLQSRSAGRHRQDWRAVEFCHPVFKHFFITTIEKEINNLDSGVTPG
jgi:hypothetical protein